MEARDRKLALLERSAVQAKAVKSASAAVRIARSLMDLGEKEKARALVAEYVGTGKFNPRLRRAFGDRLAHIDPSATLGIARELAATSRRRQTRFSGTWPSAWRRTTPPKPSAC